MLVSVIKNFKDPIFQMKKMLWIISVLFIAACTKTIPAVKVAEESMVQGCEIVATISETTDPGRPLDNYRPAEHQDRVLERAGNLGATHIVWVYDYRVGSAAVAYRCDH
jgi:hypothetical protein